MANQWNIKFANITWIEKQGIHTKSVLKLSVEGHEKFPFVEKTTRAVFTKALVDRIIGIKHLNAFIENFKTLQS